MATVALLAVFWCLRPTPADTARGNAPRFVLVYAGPVAHAGLHEALEDPRLPTLRRMRHGGALAHLWSLAPNAARDLAGSCEPSADGGVRGWRGWETVLGRAGWRVVHQRLPGAGLPTPPAPDRAEADAWILEVAPSESEKNDMAAVLRRVEGVLAAALPARRRGVAAVLLFHGTGADPRDAGLGLFWGEPFRRLDEPVSTRADALAGLLCYASGLGPVARRCGPLATDLVARRYLLHNDL